MADQVGVVAVELRRDLNLVAAEEAFTIAANELAAGARPTRWPVC